MSAYRVEIPAWADWYEAGGVVTRAQTSTAIGGGYLSSQGNNGNYIGWQVATAAGTFTLFGLYATASTGGKFQMSIDGVDVGSLTDAYTVGTVFNNVYSATALTLTEGVHTIRMTANGKHASASAYTLFPSWWALERTGA